MPRVWTCKLREVSASSPEDGWRSAQSTEDCDELGRLAYEKEDKKREKKKRAEKRKRERQEEKEKEKEARGRARERSKEKEKGKDKIKREVKIKQESLEVNGETTRLGWSWKVSRQDDRSWPEKALSRIEVTWDAWRWHKLLVHGGHSHGTSQESRQSFAAGCKDNCKPIRSWIQEDIWRRCSIIQASWAGWATTSLEVSGEVSCRDWWAWEDWSTEKKDERKPQRSQEEKRGSWEARLTVSFIQREGWRLRRGGWRVWRRTTKRRNSCP